MFDDSSVSCPDFIAFVFSAQWAKKA